MMFLLEDKNIKALHEPINHAGKNDYPQEQ